MPVGMGLVWSDVIAFAQAALLCQVHHPECIQHVLFNNALMPRPSLHAACTCCIVSGHLDKLGSDRLLIHGPADVNTL